MTDAELAVLSLLVEQPRHGYEIETVIEEREMREWTDIGFSSIYYVLGRLERQGLVAARAEGTGRGPARKVYSPTNAGIEAFGGATYEVLSTLRAPNPFMLGLSNIICLPDADAASALRSYRDALEEKRVRVESRRGESADAPPHVADLFDYGIAMLQAETAWVSGLIARKESEPKGARKVPKTKVRTDPEIVELPARKMAVVHTCGDPAELGEGVFKALYGAVYTLKFDLKKRGIAFKIEAPRARWFAGENWGDVPRDQWEAAWAIPIPEDVDEVAQKVPETPVVVETWEYGPVAQVLHLGEYSEEEPNIRRLHAFIEEQGFEIAGPHEEEYLSLPGAKQMKTIIRTQVQRRAGVTPS